MTISGGEKGLGKPSSYQSQRAVQISPLCSLNGRAFSDERIGDAGDLMCKIDLKDTYFAVALAKGSQKYVRFQWKGSLYKFL